MYGEWTNFSTSVFHLHSGRKRRGAENIPGGQEHMTLIRLIEIENFRAIRNLRWLPGPGVNCLIGPGDSGKSTILDAIDLCLGARRSLSFTDADFHAVDFSRPIR